MNPITQHYIIDLSSNNNFVQIPTVQGDGNQSRYVEIELIENGVSYEITNDTVVSIAGTKPDTKTIFNPCTIDNNGYIIVEITSQMSAVKGLGAYQIILMDKDTNSQIKSFPFYIITTEATFNVNEIVSQDEFQALTDTMAKALTDYDTVMKSAENSANTASTKASEAAVSAFNASQSEKNTAKSESNAASSAQTASKKAGEAYNSATAAKSWAVGGTDTRSDEKTDNAKYYSQQASFSASTASTKADEAYESADTASTKAGEAYNSATAAKSWAVGGTNKRSGENTNNAKYYSQQASSSASIAETKAREASDSADSAAEKASETESNTKTANEKATEASDSAKMASIKASEASSSATNAANSANTSKSYAVGTNNIVRSGDSTDNAKYYYEQAKDIYKELSYPVTGIKGDNESSYRTGRVNITKANIGLGNVDNTADADKSVKHAGSADTATNAVTASKIKNTDGGEIIMIWGGGAYTSDGGEGIMFGYTTSNGDGFQRLDSTNNIVGGYCAGSGSIESNANGCIAVGEVYGDGHVMAWNGAGSIVHGYGNSAIMSLGKASFVGGYLNAEANGDGALAHGAYVSADNLGSVAFGKYNSAMTTGGTLSNTTGHAFVVGCGTGSARKNAFSVTYDGVVKAASTITAVTTADYAEYFEWQDGNETFEDRVGYFVTLEGDKIRKATNEDEYILGIVSGEPFVLGNGDCDVWNGMYLRDEFRRTIYERAPLMETNEYGDPTDKQAVDKNGNLLWMGMKPVINPEYHPDEPYVNRADRPEWSPVGMLGVLPVRQDNSLRVNGYATVNKDGIATACEYMDKHAYRVIKLVSNDVAEVIFHI